MSTKMLVIRLPPECYNLVAEEAFTKNQTVEFVIINRLREAIENIDPPEILTLAEALGARWRPAYGLSTQQSH